MDLIIKKNCQFKNFKKGNNLVVFDSDKIPYYNTFNNIEKITTIEIKELLDNIFKDVKYLNSFTKILLIVTRNNYIYNKVFIEIYKDIYKDLLNKPSLVINIFNQESEFFCLENLTTSEEKIYYKNSINYLDETLPEKEDYYFKIKDLIEKKEYFDNIVVIFSDDRFEVLRHIVNKNIRIINYTREENLEVREKKINVLILDRFVALPYTNIKLVVIENLKSRETLENINKYFLESGKIEILMTQSNFKNLPYIEIENLYEKDLFMLSLKLIKNKDLNSHLILDSFSQYNIFHKLEKYEISKDNELLIEPELFFKISLDIKPSLLIYRVIKEYKNLPLFPFIILAVLIDKNLTNNSILEFFEAWFRYSQKFDSLIIDDKDLDGLFDDLEISNYLFKNIIEKVISIYRNIYNYQYIEIAKFDSLNLLKEATPILVNIYKGDIFHLMDNEKTIYTNNKIVLKLDLKTDTKYPENIVIFKHDSKKIYSWLKLY